MEWADRLGEGGDGKQQTPPNLELKWAGVREVEVNKYLAGSTGFPDALYVIFLESL